MRKNIEFKVPTKAFIKYLMDEGFKEVNGKGSHRNFKMDGLGKITVPNHKDYVFHGSLNQYRKLVGLDTLEDVVELVYPALLDNKKVPKTITKITIPKRALQPKEVNVNRMSNNQHYKVEVEVMGSITFEVPAEDFEEASSAALARLERGDLQYTTTFQALDEYDIVGINKVREAA